MNQNTQKVDRERQEESSLQKLLQFMKREQPPIQVIRCQTCDGNDQVDPGSHLCSNCRKLPQENVKESEQAHVEESDQSSEVEFSDEERIDEERIDDIMKQDFDALIKNKGERELFRTASLLIRQFKHKDFATKAVKLSKVLEKIWAADVKKFEEKNDGKCVKCKNDKIGGRIGRCGKCYEKVKYWRKKLRPGSYNKCHDCREVRFLKCAERCDTCYRKNLEKRKREALEEALKRASSPIKLTGRTTRNSLRARSSQFFKDDQQLDSEQELEQKRKPPKDQQHPESSKRPKLSTHRDSSKPSDVLHEGLMSRPKYQQSSESPNRPKLPTPQDSSKPSDVFQKGLMSHPKEQVSMPLKQIQSPTEHHVTSPESNDQAKSLGNKDSHEASPIGHTANTPPMFNCFGCRKIVSQHDLSPKERICMGCFTIALVVNSRPDHVEHP